MSSTPLPHLAQCVDWSNPESIMLVLSGTYQHILSPSLQPFWEAQNECTKQTLVSDTNQSMTFTL